MDVLTKRFLLGILYVRKSNQQAKKYPTSTIQTYGINCILTDRVDPLLDLCFAKAMQVILDLRLAKATQVKTFMLDRKGVISLSDHTHQTYKPV